MVNGDTTSRGRGGARGTGQGRAPDRGRGRGRGRSDGQGGGRNGGGGRDGGQGGRSGRGAGGYGGRGYGGRGRGGDGAYQARGSGGSYRGAQGPGSGRGSFNRGGRGAPRPQACPNIGNMSCSRFITHVLGPCAPARLAQAVVEMEPMWTASWRQAATLDGTSVRTLLTALARLPASAAVTPPRLRDVVAVVAAFLRYASDACNTLGTGLSLEEAKLSAVEVVEKVFQRLTKFTWSEARDDVHSALNDMLTDADQLLEPRYATHRKARQRVMDLFSELDKPWVIRTSTMEEASYEDEDNGVATVSPWKKPTIAWLSDWNHFQPLKLPAMKVPGGHGDGVYESPDEYFDTTIQLWTGMTFIDGHNALLPHCTLQTNGKICDQPLWPMHARGYSDCQCRTRNCPRLVEYVCANRMHHVGLCKPCALDRQQKLRGPPSERASTHIYDATVRTIRFDGKIYLADFASRRPPAMQIHWKTTRRLSSPNLVGIVLLSSRGGSLKLSDEIYWAKVALHGQPRDEFKEREAGRLALELLEYSVDEIGNPLLSREVEQGASVAIIDCQTFVPEFIPVLKALERQREMPMPFQSGALVNLKRLRGRDDGDDEEFMFGGDGGSATCLMGEGLDGSDESDDDGTPGNASSNPLEGSAIRSLIHVLVENSMLDPIVQIRRDTTAAEQLRLGLTKLVTHATLDRGQLESFIGALVHPVHCTQGPPGTGKSYLGVVVVRALLMIRKLWMHVCPSVGEPPILVLSYKNHAIDEFLVDLVKAEMSIQHNQASLVRLGGGCTEPTLYRFQESNVIASTKEVATLTKSLDELHQLASKVRSVRNAFGVIYEAHVLITGSGQANHEGDDGDAKRDRNKVLFQASAELAKIAATIVGISQLEETMPKTEDVSEVNSDDESKPEASEKIDAVAAADKYVAKNVTLTQRDIAVLYDGIRHYDPQIDPAEILLKWMGGFVPVPACAYAEEECTHLADPTESIFCKQHRCHFASTSAENHEQFCQNSVVPQCGFCRDHLCSMEDCHAPVFRDNQVLCTKHACFVCIREKSPEDEIFAAQDAPPRNTCWEHPLCWGASRDGQCENVVTSVDSSYCPEHSVSKCQGKTRSGAPCTVITISRSTPFCYSHLSQAHGAASSSTIGQTARATPGKCAATNAKRKPCKGTPAVGMMFCVNHAGKAKAPIVPEVFMHQDIAQSPGREDESVAVKVGDEHKDGVDGGNVPDETCLKSATISLLEEAGVSTAEKGETAVSDDAASDAASDASGSFVDLAIDQALPNAEEDFDEPDHIQHLRDVDEVETGGSGEDEFMFGDEDDTADGEGYAQELDDGFVEYAALSVAEWHWDMSLDQRWQAIRALVSHWDPLAHKMIQAIRAKFELTKRQLQQERSRAKTKMYEGRAIIGGTITGCVTRLEAIRATKPFAILVEEASEVLEPLLFACLGSTTCKLEMIGDHLQLQPSVMSKFDFERINKINISMFERLIRAPGEYEVPSSVLSLQRRMRKNIADLTREFYVDITAIEDHSICDTKTIQTTLRFPQRRQLYGSSLLSNAVDKVRLTPARGREVPGVAPHLFFWTHGGREEKARVGLSRINSHEADMACHLAKYLTECGVPGKSIAILTPYKGQLMLMRNLLMSQQFGMKVIGRDQRAEPSCTLSTVDRFQGDEADIVIVSLVIDGKSRTPFVKLQNRMIVLLSRARIGMYVVGNIDYFTNAATSAPPHWQATLDKLRLPAPSDNTPDVDAVWPSFDQARIGAALPLCCPQHRDSVHSVENPKKLALSFCGVVCRHALECSHECGKRCHWSVLDQHAKTCDVQVDSPCVRHPKSLKCAQVCQATNRKRVADALIAYRCAALVELQLPCTHVQRVACAQEVDVLEKKTAWPKCTEQAITPYVYPDCKHELSCSCDAYYGYQSGSARAPNCSIDVEYVPPCGHTTTLKCYARKGIVEGRNQYTCAQKVKAVLPRCGHEVTTSCPTASALRSWSGASSTTFGIVEERVTYGPADHPCTNKVIFRRECGHETRVQCSAAFNMASTKPPCPEPVSFSIPECGHVYPTTCADARRLQQRVDQTFNVQPCSAPVDTVKEDERLSVYRNFGLNVQCKSSVTLRRNCGHEQVLPCHQARSTSQPCGETTEATRPDCGHAFTLPCALIVELQSWQPWSQVPSEQRAAVDMFISSGIVCMSLPAPQRPLSTALQTALGQCKRSVLLRRNTSCGHEGRFPCDQAAKILRGEGKAPVCNQLTTKALGCGHTVEVSCCVDVTKYRCKQKVAMPCWNSQVCHQTVETECALGNTGSPVKLSCQSRTLWTCASGKHNYQVAVCSRGEPTACPACSFDSLTAMIERVRSVCMAGPSESVPWPPVDAPTAVMQVPAFASSTSLRYRAKLEFYQRQLNVLERFRGWIEQEEDVWTRALFQPMFFPVFTVIDASKTTVKSPVMRFELKDFASTMTWNSLQAYPVVAKNVSHMVPPAGGGSNEAPTARRVVFGVFFSVGLNVAPSDAPTANKFGSKHTQWIENQQQELGFDSAFFAKTKNGTLSQGGTLRVWDPFAMFPTGEATVVASQQKAIASCLAGEFEVTVKPFYGILPARFLVFKPREALSTSPGSVGKAEDGATPSGSFLSPDDEEACRQLFEALPFAWAAGIRLFYPWPGKPLLIGGTSLPESVERQMHDKLVFLRRLSGEHGQGAKKKTKGPFDGINYLKTVTTKQPFEEAELLMALDLLEVQKTATKDALAKLEQYVEHASQCHPLVLVALGRLLARNPGISPRVRPDECLRLFKTIYPDAAKLWLSAAELKMVDTIASGNAASAKDETTMTVDERWAKLKAEQNCSSNAMDELLKMVGLARVKRFAINMFKSALAFQRMTPSQRKKNAMAMNYCFVGNPGTGKTTVAKLFARILKDSGMRRNSTALICGAQQLKDEGTDKFRGAIQKAMGGVVFVDEAYELEPSSDPKGKPIVAEILVAAEEHRHDLSMILAGYEDDIQQKLYAHNDGLRSRFTEVVFEDFDEADLRVIWDGLLTEREWACDDKVSTIACRRLARGAGRKGFGNARDVRQLFERAAAEAMAREDFDDVMELRAVDVIGERPSKNLKLELLVQELNDKIGWKRIKQRVKELIDICDANYERELNGRETLSVVMNRLFLGNPGTGKTTCASLYGKLLKHLGFLSNGDVVKKTAGDFVGQYIGQSQTKTNEILKLAKGKLLIIDEAYNLNDNWYGKQVLDVLVEKVQGSDSDDIAVILIGYEHQMTEMLRTQNPGLARRFPIEYAFYFDDYDDQELFDIFSAACERKQVDCPLDLAQEVVKLLSMQRRQANFGNAGAVEMLLKNAMANASKRPLQHGETRMLLQLEDIENEMAKRAKDDGGEGEASATKAPEDPLLVLDKLYRMDNIKDELQRLRTRIQVAEEEGEEWPEIGHFVFRGSPGTGKTTVARTMGKILHNMGLLGSDRVVETSGLNLTGEYLGQTKKKVEEQLGQARGAILFIDEAYELGKGHYGEEAMTTLVAAMTDPMYDGMVIIIAGYPADMDAMLDRNAGLKSRFTRFLEFPDWETSDCVSFMQSRSTREKYALTDNAVDALERLFTSMRLLPGFGNGRDVDKVWKSVLECRAQRVVGKPELERTITLSDVETASQRVLAAREPPKAERLSRPEMGGYQRLQTDSASSEPPRFEVVTESAAEQEADEAVGTKQDEERQVDEDEATSDECERDPGVSDDVWEELERAKQAYKQMLQDMKDAEDRKKQEEARRKAELYQKAQEKLRRLAKCPAGYEWKQVGGGWRCGGGSHFVSNETLEKNFMY